MTFDTKWYVVHTHSHAEAKAAAHLERQGFQVYLPRYLKRRRHARRVQQVPAALFPRYLFVALDVTAQRWRAIESTIGVSHMICNGDRPVAVRHGVVEHLRNCENGDGLVRLDERPRFAIGDRVCIIDGVFSTCFGLFQGMSDKDRVSVLLDMLGRKVRVVLDADLVGAA